MDSLPVYAYEFLLRHQQFLQIVDAIGSISAIVLAIGLPAYWYVSTLRNYRAKQYPNLVNFSLNYFDGPALQMRTLLELPIDQVWPNDHRIRLIRDAVKRTTVESPFLSLKNAEDMRDVNQAALNKLSALFAGTFVAKSQGLNVATANYVFAITFEKFEVMNTRKLRVLIIREDELFQVQSAPDQRDLTHQQRLFTLRKMHELNVREPYSLGKVQLGVPCDPGMQTPTQPIPESLPDSLPLSPPLPTRPQAPEWQNPIDDGFMD